MSNQLKNPIFWCLIAIMLGGILAVIGWNRNDAIGNYKGAGFLMWTGGIILASGLIGWQVLGKGKRK